MNTKIKARRYVAHSFKAKDWDGKHVMGVWSEKPARKEYKRETWTKISIAALILSRFCERFMKKLER